MSVRPVVQVRVAVEVGSDSMQLVLLVSDDGSPESRVAIPIAPDDARSLADALFVGAKRIDPRGHDAMVDRLASHFQLGLAARQPTAGGVH